MAGPSGNTITAAAELRRVILGTLYQAVEKRDLRRWASSFVIAAYWLYASFLRIRPPCTSSFLTGLPVIGFINGQLCTPDLPGFASGYLVDFLPPLRQTVKPRDVR